MYRNNINQMSLLRKENHVGEMVPQFYSEIIIARVVESFITHGSHFLEPRIFSRHIFHKVTIFEVDLLLGPILLPPIIFLHSTSINFVFGAHMGHELTKSFRGEIYYAVDGHMVHRFKKKILPKLTLLKSFVKSKL